MTTELSNIGTLPSSNVNPNELAKRYKTTTQYVKRLQLVTKGKLVDQGLIKPGHWGVPLSEDNAEDLGDSVDVLVLAIRDKALDTNSNPPVASFDPDSDVFKSIVEAASQKDSGCMYGPSFLVYERSTGQFLEVFFGNASGRQEAGKMIPFLPISEEQAKSFGKNFKARGPQAATLKSKYIKRPRYAWHAPVVVSCSTPFDDLPPTEDFVSQINAFLNPKDDAPETDSGKGRDR